MIHNQGYKMHYTNNNTEDYSPRDNLPSKEDYDLYISKDNEDYQIDDEFKDFFEKLEENEDE